MKLGAVVIFVLFIAVVVASRITSIVMTSEYTFWGGALARGLVRVAARLQHRSNRERFRKEWSADLIVLQRTERHAGLLWALKNLLAAPVVRRAARRDEAAETASDHDETDVAVFVDGRVVVDANLYRQLKGDPKQSILRFDRHGNVAIKAFGAPETNDAGDLTVVDGDGTRHVVEVEVQRTRRRA